MTADGSAPRDQHLRRSRPPRNFRPHRVVWLGGGAPTGRHERPANPRKTAMTGPFSARRRAEEFDAAISRPLTEQDAQEFAELLAVVRDLRAIPAPAPRTEFVSDLRVRLMAEADTALLPQAARPLTAERTAPRAAGAVLPPRPSPRHAARSRRPGRRDHLDGGGRPDRPARRVALPRQARDRGRPDRHRPRRHRHGPRHCSPTRAAGSTRSMSSPSAATRPASAPSGRRWSPSASRPAKPPTRCLRRTPRRVTRQ